jgi:hypothetical protein
MNIQTVIKPEIVVSTCSPDTEFCEYSFSICQGLTWFFGRGVSAFIVERSKDNANNQIVTLKALVPPKELRFAQVTSVGVLSVEGYWPKDLAFDKVWKVPGFRQEIRDGQHRLFRSGRESGTLMQQYGLLPDTPIGEIAFGLADLITGFFWQGAKWVKHQSSLGMVQTMTDLGFEGDELRRYLMDPDPGYTVHQKISTMPK